MDMQSQQHTQLSTDNRSIRSKQVCFNHGGNKPPFFFASVKLYQHLIKPRCRARRRLVNRLGHLVAKTVEGTALALESIDDIHGDDSLTAGMLSVGD